MVKATTELALVDPALAEPDDECLGLPIAQQVDRSPALQIHNYRAVHLTALLGLIVYTNQMRCVQSWRRPLADQTEQRVTADGHRQVVCQPAAALPARRMGNRFQGGRQSV
jgi:hypothetical protein